MTIRSLRLRVFLGLAVGLAATLVLSLVVSASGPAALAAASPDGLWRVAGVAPESVPTRSAKGAPNFIKASKFRLLTLDAAGIKAALAKAGL